MEQYFKNQGSGKLLFFPDPVKQAEKLMPRIGNQAAATYGKIKLIPRTEN